MDRLLNKGTIIRFASGKRLWILCFLVAFTALSIAIASLLPPVPRLKLATDSAQAVIGFSPDGKYILSMDADVSEPIRAPIPTHCKWPIRKWSATSGAASGEISLPVGDKSKGVVRSSVLAVKCSPDGKSIAAISQPGNQLWVFDIETGRALVKIEDAQLGNEAQLLQLGLGFSPNSDYIVAEDANYWQLFPISHDFAEYELDPEWISSGSGHYSSFEENVQPPLRAPSFQRARNSSFSRCGKFLLTLDRDATNFKIKVRELMTGREIQRYAPFHTVTITNNGKSVVIRDGKNPEQILLGEGVLTSRLPLECDIRPQQHMSTNNLFSFHPQWNQISLVLPDSIGYPENDLDLCYFEHIRWSSAPQAQAVTHIPKFSCFADAADGQFFVSINEPQGTPVGRIGSLEWRDFGNHVHRTLCRVNLSGARGNLFITDDGQTVAISFSKFNPLVDIWPRLARDAFKKVSQWTGRDLEVQLLGKGMSRIEFWEGPNARIIGVIRNQLGLGFSPDGRTFATQDNEYNITFWDVPLRRNWPLAIGMAILPSAFATVLFYAFVVIARIVFQRLFRRRFTESANPTPSK